MRALRGRQELAAPPQTAVSRVKAARSQQTAAERILELQRTVGNRAVVAMLERNTSTGGCGQSCPLPGNVPRPVRRSATGDALGGTAVDALTERAIQRCGPGTVLPTGVRRQMESGFGADFSGVRVHHGPEAQILSRSLQAHAFTKGSDIFFGVGDYQPGTRSGQQLLAHELAHVVQHASGDETRRKTIQRRFGMEIELPGVLVTSLGILGQDYPKLGLHAGEGVLGEPLYDPSQPKAGESLGGDFLLHIDHSDSMGGVFEHVNDTQTGFEKKNKGPILELVTPPLDEFKMSDLQITALFKKMGLFAAAAVAGEGKELTKVKSAQTSTENFVGVPKKSTRTDYNIREPLRSPKMHTGGSLQATYGVKLERLSELLELQSDPAGPAKSPAAPAAPKGASGGGGSGPPPPPMMAISPPKTAAKDTSQAVLAEARQKADSVVAALLQRYRSKRSYDAPKGKNSAKIVSKRRTFKNDFSFADAGELAEVRALSALMLNYLLAGDRKMGFGWGKNMVGQLFYKSRLSSVRNEIVGDQDTLLRKRADRVIELVLKESGRNVGDMVLQGRVDPETGIRKQVVSVSCEDWVTEVVDGTGDTVFDDLKNAYGEEIKPEKIGPAGNQDLAVIMENRSLGKLVQPKVNNLKAGLASTGTDPSLWPEYAVKLAQMLRVINGTGPPDLDNIRALLKN